MNTQSSGLSRRSFLTAAGGVTLGLGIARVPPAAAAAADPLPPLPWKAYYARLDPVTVRQAGYWLYYKEGGCGHPPTESDIRLHFQVFRGKKQGKSDERLDENPEYG